MVPDEYLRRSHVRTPNGQGLSIAVEGDVRVGPYEARPATSVTILFSPASRVQDPGFRIARIIQYADGNSPKRTPVPGVHATLEDAVAEFKRWAGKNIALNLPTKSKRDHLAEGAFFYGGRYGDQLCKVIGVTGNGKVHYTSQFGQSKASIKDFLSKMTTPAHNPDPAEIAQVEATLQPGWRYEGHREPDPYRGAVRREGSLDWHSGRYQTEAQVERDHAWATETSNTDGNYVSLFRRSSRPQYLEVPDEYNACAVARTAAEAWILAEMLEGFAGKTTEPGDAYEPTYVDGDRRGWVRRTESGHLTLHRGSDEHPDDVVVTQFSRSSPYEVMHVAWLRVPRPTRFGEGPWDRGPIRNADLMGAALGLTEILVQADRLGRPLERDDWKAWQHGFEIDPGKPAPGWNPPARGHDCPRGPEVVEASLALLEADPNGRSDLHEAAEDALRKLVPSYGPKRSDLPFNLGALSRDVSAQYTLAADLLGKERADAIARAAPAMSR